MTPLRKWSVVAAMVLGFGAVRLPLEHAMDAERRAAGLRRDDAGLSLRQQASESALIGVLGGLRALVAAFWDLWARDAWLKTNWGEVEKDYRFIQWLQPRVFYYWDVGQWMMATNAANSFAYDKSKPPGIAELMSQAYVEKGRSMIEDGLKHLPDEWRMHQAMALLLESRYAAGERDHLQISEAWRKAAECPGALGYCQRQRAYHLCLVPGREREAYGLLRALHARGKENRVPTLIAWIQYFEHTLDIPSPERLFPAAAPGREPPRPRQPIP